MSTPACRQYFDIEARYPDALLAYNIGDFYEFFDHDAETAAREFHLTLTARSFGPDEVVPLAGVPTHAIEVYSERLQSPQERARYDDSAKRILYRTCTGSCPQVWANPR